VRRQHLDTLVDVIVRTYAPLPARSLTTLVRRLRYGVPQWAGELDDALVCAKRRLAHARLGGVDWYWPEGEKPRAFRHKVNDQVRLLAPFDPIVWDRCRFELLWEWRYRFEAYTPAPKRRFGYYSLPLLWHDMVIGWANLSVKDGALLSAFGYATRPPRDRRFLRELEAELDRMLAFLRY
jgi:hypothetical protein